MGVLSANISLTQQVVLVAWLAVFAAFALMGLRDFLTNLEANRCEMTTMYKRPQYFKIPLRQTTSETFPGYALYLYGEGDYAKTSKDLKVTGIPVLFIPGNAGSHRQVRSLASVALWKAEGSSVHFDYFMVALDESLSGLSGAVMLEQTEFIYLCVTRVLWLYRELRNPPTSVVLVGHSMGGLIARGLFMLPKFNPKQVHTIITLGTPHSHPILYFDPQLVEYYENVNNFWRKEAFGSQPALRLMNVTFLSVSGGHRDVVVRSSPSSMSQLAPQSQAISVVATSVPRAWVSIDHLCLCWCRQLVLVTNRALFAMIDPQTKQITEDKQVRQRIFEHFFVKNPGTRKVVLNYRDSLLVEGTGLDYTQVALHKRIWRFKGGGSTTTEHKLFVFSIEEWSATHDFLMILTTIDTDQWLLGCQKTSEQACSNMTDLSHNAELLMWNGAMMKFAKLNLGDFPGISYFAVHLPQSKKVDILWSEYQSSINCTYQVELPGLLSRKYLLLDIPSDSLFANISLKSVAKSWKVYIVYIQATDCDISKSLIVGRVHVPWFNEDVYGHSSNGSVNLVVKLHHPKPKGNQEQVQIHLWLDPKCSYRISAQHDFYQMLGQIFRFYAVQLPCWTFCIVLLVFAWQLSSMSNEQHCDSFFNLVANTAKSLGVLLLLIQSHFFISQVLLAYFAFQGEPGQHGWLPNIDDLKTFIWLFPLILIACTAVIIVIAMFVWIGMFVRFGSLILSCFPFSFQKRPKLGVRGGIFAVVIVLTSLLFCGTLSLIFTFALCLCRTLKYAAMFRIYQQQPIKQRDKTLLNLFKSVTNMALTLCVLLFLVIVVNLPALAVWATKLQYSYHLPSDHTALISVVIGLNIIAFDFLIQVPRSLVYLCFIMGVAVTQAPVIPLHMVPYTICLLLTELNIAQFLDRFKKGEVQGRLFDLFHQCDKMRFQMKRFLVQVVHVNPSEET